MKFYGSGWRSRAPGRAAPWAARRFVWPNKCFLASRWCSASAANRSCTRPWRSPSGTSFPFAPSAASASPWRWRTEWVRLWQISPTDGLARADSSRAGRFGCRLPLGCNSSQSLTSACSIVSSSCRTLGSWRNTGLRFRSPVTPLFFKMSFKWLIA